MVEQSSGIPVAPQPHAHATRWRSYRRWRRWLLVTCVLLATLVASLPTLVGARWIYQPLLDQLAAKNFRLSIESVHLRWLSPLRLQGITLSQADNNAALLTIAHIKTDRSLLGYLLGGRRLGRLEIIQPTVAVELLKDGTNLDQIAQAIANASHSPPKEKRAPPAFDIQVVIRDASAKVMQPTAGQLVVIPPFNLEANYQAAPRPEANNGPRLIIPPTQILNQVLITKELVDIGLGHAVPLLAQSAWFDGSVSLAVGQVNVPLDNPQLSTGTMQLTLHQVRSGPNQPAITRLLDLVASLRQREPVHELVFVDGSVIDVALADQRVTHSGLKFGLPKMDSRFQIATSGSVGIVDKSLDLLIDIPVPVEQVARREQVQALGVPTLSLPVSGTLEDPVIDWNAMRGEMAALLGNIRQALGDDAPVAATVVTAVEGLAEGQADEAIGAAVDLVKQLRERRQQRSTNQSPTATADDPDAQPVAPQRPVRDALRDLLKRRQESKE